MSSLQFARAPLATGLQAHYATQGNPDGEPVLFLHGWPDSWFSFSRVLPHLPPTFRALVPDQRGFGDSGRPDAGYAIEDFAADAVAFLDAVGVERATLVGHSFGTFVARHVAIAHPDRVAHLALIGTSARPVNAVTREVQASLVDLADPVPEEFAREFQASTAHAPLPAPFFDRVVVESLKAPARIWRDALNGLMAYDDEDELAGITAPTLLLWGEHDGLFPRADQEALLGAIEGARLVEYPDTGHCPNWERPERVAADLASFLVKP